jgi:hypothetical protein
MGLMRKKKSKQALGFNEGQLSHFTSKLCAKLKDAT